MINNNTERALIIVIFLFWIFIMITILAEKYPNGKVDKFIENIVGRKVD